MPPRLDDRISRQFGPDPSLLAEVRDFVSEGAGVDRQHPFVLVASELAANAIRHAGGDFTVTLSRNGFLEVEVTDPSTVEPRMKPGDVGGGYGLRLIDALASRWGTKQRPGGKTVWARVPVEEPDF